MIIEQYGIRLVRLTEDDLELVRHWRNHPKIRLQMGYQKIISASMQQKWFQSINNDFNLYFIIEYQGEKIGLINSKNIDYEKRQGEGGIFIWADHLTVDFVPVLASLCFLNCAFHVFGFTKSYIQILNSNKIAQRYNHQLGYTLVPGQKDTKTPYYILTKEDYILKTKKLNKAAQLFTQDFEVPRVTQCNISKLLQLHSDHEK